MENNYKYNGDFSNVVTIPDLKKQVFINALCFTNNIPEAASEIGVSKRHIFLFMGMEKLNDKIIKQMRREFKESGIKVKKRINN